MFVAVIDASTACAMHGVGMLDAGGGAPRRRRFGVDSLAKHGPPTRTAA